jgi:ABC-2 type transport system ATP-binding protein
VESKGLTKKFGNFTALDDLNVKILRGETYGLLGPNGSGKTTLIKILTGLLRPTSGSASVLGRTVPSRKSMAEVGYMPQDIAVYFDNTVHENIKLFGEIYSMPRLKLEKREKEVLEFVDLLDWKDALTSTLSGGMRHRLSLACAIVHEPTLLFLDEPTVGVDPELRASFWDYFKSLGEKGTTVILTTHYMDEASHCSRVGLLRMGKLIAEGAPDELKKTAGVETLEDAFLSLARRQKQ